MLYTEDEVFDNEEDAEKCACECAGNFVEETEVLMYAGRDYIPRNDVNFVVEEIDDKD